MFLQEDLAIKQNLIKIKENNICCITCDIKLLQFTDFWLSADLALIHSSVTVHCWVDGESPHS